MVNALIVFLIMGLLMAGILLQPLWVKRQRNRLQRRPFPPMWQAIVTTRLPLYDQLTPDERRQLQGHIQVFLAEKQFIGCGGLQVTEEMRVTIAAIACLLLLNRPSTYFPKLRSILVYPGTYQVRETMAIDSYVVEEQNIHRLGESWSRDQLLLAWEQVDWDTNHWQDGHNLVLHEFAHQLDQEDGQAQGVPILATNTDYTRWAQVMTKAYQQLCLAIQQQEATLLDPYGATNPAEFFAVATETFFEQPHSLQAHHPDLYTLLQDYYRLNPLQWRWC